MARRARFARTSAEGGGGGNPPPAPNPAPGTPPAPAPRTFSQDEVTAIATRESKAAETAAQSKLLQSLGFESVEAAQAAVTAAKAAEEAGKTQLQRDQDAAVAAKAAADAEKAEAARERFETKVERALARAGVAIDDEAKLGRLRRMITLDASADAAAIDAEIATLKTDFPALFAATSGGNPPPAPGSDPQGRPPATPPGSKSALERGRERAKERAKATSGGGYLKPPGL